MSDSIFDAWSDNPAPQPAPQEPKQEAPEAAPAAEPQAPQTQAAAPQEPENIQSKETSEAPIENKEPQAPTIDDSQVLEYLNGQLGTKYGSLEELKAKEQPNEDLDPIAKSYNQYAKETGKGLNDWIRLQNLSSQIAESKDEDLVRLKFEYENPHLAPDEVADLFEAEYSKVEIDEDFMSEAEVEKAKKHNRLVDIRLKSAAVQAKEFLGTQVEKYKAPEQKQDGGKFEIEGFQENYKNFLENEIEEVEFDLGDGNTFSLKVDEALKQTSVNTPEEFLSSFVDEQGNWDIERWSTTMMVAQHIDKILKIAVDQKSSEAKENLIKNELKNTSIDSVHRKQEDKQSTAGNPYVNMGKALWS
jgi:hypothetical protein